MTETQKLLEMLISVGFTKDEASSWITTMRAKTSATTLQSVLARHATSSSYLPHPLPTMTCAPMDHDFDFLYLACKHCSLTQIAWWNGIA